MMMKAGFRKAHLKACAPQHIRHAIAEEPTSGGRLRYVDDALDYLVVETSGRQLIIFSILLGGSGTESGLPFTQSTEVFDKTPACRAAAHLTFVWEKNQPCDSDLASWFVPIRSTPLGLTCLGQQPLQAISRCTCS